MCRVSRKGVRTNARLSQLHNTLVNQVLNSVSQSSALICSMSKALMISTIGPSENEGEKPTVMASVLMD